MNLQPSGYEPDELPIAPPRDIISIFSEGSSPIRATPAFAGLHPAIYNFYFNIGAANITIRTCDVNKLRSSINIVET